MSNRVHPDKLMGSKWTAREPQHGERHFLVVRVLREGSRVTQVVLEAILTRRHFTTDWRALKDPSRWHQGWDP